MVHNIQYSFRRRVFTFDMDPSMKLTLTQIEAFSTVLTVGTATGAASVLNTSQPSITRSLKQIEDATGLQLFDREKGRLVPTGAAHELSVVVSQSFKGVSDIRQAAEAIRKRQDGHLRIACLPALSQGFLARAVSDLVEELPNISVSIQTLMSKDIHKAVHNRYIDVGIAAYEIEDPGLSIAQFTSMDEVVVMPSDHALASKDTITPADFAGERLIALAAFDPYRIRLDNILVEGEIHLSGTFEAETSAGACALVSEGVGLALINPLTALDFINRGLVMRKFATSLPFVTMMVAGPSKQRPMLQNRFVQALQDRYRADMAEVYRLCQP